MKNALRNSVAIPFILMLTAPSAAFSQDTTVECDPATDPLCVAAEIGAEPEAQASEEPAPEAEAEPEAETESVEEAAPEMEAPESTAETEPAAEPEAQPVEEAPTEEAATEAAPDEPAEAAATTETPADATPEADSAATEAPAEEPAAETENAVSETPVEQPAEATATDDAVTEAPAEATSEPQSEPETAEATADATEQETAETEAQIEGTTESAATVETLEIDEPETVLSEDTGLTEEAAAAEATAAEELNDTTSAAAAVEEGTAPEGAEPEVEVTTVTEEAARTSEQEFATVATDKKGDKGLSTLEKLLILGVGAAVVGELLDDNQVVQNTGDRVILQRSDGSLQVLRDDDILLRRPGYEVETRTYNDGSTVSEITKLDGSIVRTVKDSRGRVLRRTRILPSGREVVLFDDTADFEPVDIDSLPLQRSSSLDYLSDNGSLDEALSANLMADVGRTFSLSQIRNIRAVRELVPVIDLEAITFDTNSAAIRASEARKLDRLAIAMKSVIDDRPWEVFLIEGHTDAVGSSVSNLTLSDRRAESLALALTEYYDIPSENLVVQGYGERYLKVPVVTDERRNRRVTVRRITPLLGMDVASAQPAVGSSTDVTDFEGARAGQAEGGLQALGYEPVRTEGLTTFWYNYDTGACARIRTSNGRYSDVTMLPAGDC